jgi:hypothetical protein
VHFLHRIYLNPFPLHFVFLTVLLTPPRSFREAILFYNLRSFLPEQSFGRDNREELLRAPLRS